MAVKLALTSSGAAKLLAVASMAGLAGGGYTLASSATDAGPGQSAAARAAHAPQTHASESDDATETTTAAEAAETSEADETASATPSPNLKGLCNAYQAHRAGNPDGWKQSAAFQVLITTAGGDAKVADYCVTLIGPATTHGNRPTAAPGKPKDLPGPGAHPGKPSGAPGPQAHPSSSDDTESSDAPDSADSGAPAGHGVHH